MDENNLERISHEHALALAAQAVIDAAVHLSDQACEEYNHLFIVSLGAFQDLQNAIDTWRELGGQTTDERNGQ